MTRHLELTRAILTEFDVPGLFISCVEEFDLVVTTRNPSREFDLLCTKLSLQRLRAVIWGEAVGLLPGASPRYGPELKVALKEHLINLNLAFVGCEVFYERFLLGNGSPEEQHSRRAAAAIAGLPIFRESFEACKERIQIHRRREKDSWPVSRWSVYDLGRFASTIDNVVALLNTLEGITACLGIVEEQQSRMRSEISLVTGEASLRMLDDAWRPRKPSPVLSVVPEAIRGALKPLSTSLAQSDAASPAKEGLLLAVPSNPRTKKSSNGKEDDQFGLCDACRSITLPMLVNGFRHALDFDQVQQSKGRCRFCALLSEAYDSQTCIYHRHQPCDKDHRGRLQWALEGVGPGVRFGQFKLDSAHYGGAVRIYVKEESMLFKCGVFTQRDVQPAFSPRNVRLLRTWLDECRSNHDECQRGTYSGKQFDDSSSSAALPFRVIDVGAADSSEAARLVTTSGQMTGRYLTLSHCWGKVEPTKTTRATVAAWHVALPQQLSRTFQDAIRLTRELRERFLWIDSLCIIQDDPGDLGAQISLMGTIFEQAYCAIIAVDAKGAHGDLADRGLFLSGARNVVPRLWVNHVAGSRLDDPYNTGASQSAWGTPEEGAQPIFMEPLPNQSDLFSLRLEQKGWYTRGWVYQEKELSRRCIFYTDETLAWRCNRYWETEQTGVPERRIRASAHRIEASTISGFTYDARHAARMLWQASVEEYSGKKLTYVSDKAKAIRGLEERTAARCAATFRWGLMELGAEDVLLSQLLWAPKAARGLRVGDPGFECPSWSWMAVDGPAGWMANEHLAHAETLSEVSFCEAGGRPALHIQGPCREIRIGGPIGEIPHFSEFDRWPLDMHFGWTELALHPGTNTVVSAGEIVRWVVLDTDQDPGQIVAGPLLQYVRLDDETESMCVDFLALARLKGLSGQGLYYRVGRGRTIKGAFAWVEGCQKDDILVV